VHSLAQKAYIAAKLQKHKIVKGEDFYQTIRDDEKFDFLRLPMPLPEELEEVLFNFTNPANPANSANLTHPPYPSNPVQIYEVHQPYQLY
jgi:hypothetical protein